MLNDGIYHFLTENPWMANVGAPSTTLAQNGTTLLVDHLMFAEMICLSQRIM